MTVDRRSFLVGLWACAGLVGTMTAAPVIAQVNTPQTLASTFMGELVSAARSEDVNAVEAVIARRVDMAYVAQAVLGDQADTIDPEVLGRLIPALRRNLAQQATGFMAYGPQGSVRWGQERSRGSGTEVAGTFISNSRDLQLPSSGLALNVLVGSHSRTGDLAVRDMSLGGEWVTSTMGDAFEAIMEMTDDPEVWIASLGGAPMPVPDISLENFDATP